jgi:hypothetical protein
VIEEEKNKSIVEIVISSVKPFQLMMGKKLWKFIGWNHLTPFGYCWNFDFLCSDNLFSYETAASSMSKPIQKP